MPLRIGFLTGVAGRLGAREGRARQAAAMTWLVERDVDVVAVEGEAASGGAGPLRLSLGGPSASRAVDLVVRRSAPPRGPVVGDASLASGVPTVVVGGAGGSRGSTAAGPVLELRSGAAGDGSECAMVELAEAEDGRLWAWRETGRLALRDSDGGPILSTTREAWVFDGSCWRLGSAESGGG